MTDLLSKPVQLAGSPASQYPTVSLRGVVLSPRTATILPAGALRFGGDSPSGLVLAGGSPAARTVDLFDRETRAFVATTVSASDGTYAFVDLPSRSEGYDVVIRGVISSGERDVIVPGVHPG